MNQTFAYEVKSFLCESRIKKSCCKTALVYGMLICGRFSWDEIKLTSECPEVLTLAKELLDDCFDAEGTLLGNTVSITDEVMRRNVLLSLGYAEDEEGTSIKTGSFECGSCEKMFARGLFLSCGSVSNPDSGYHLQLTLKNRAGAVSVSDFLAAAGLPARISRRGGEYTVYYKESYAIEDFLNFIGAQKAAFDLMNVKIKKDIRNNANRLANCETANISKTVDAAAEQLDIIRELIGSGELDRLPPSLRRTALLRFENVDATLAELAALHDPPLTKSGVNHRLARIGEYASGTKSKREG